MRFRSRGSTAVWSSLQSGTHRSDEAVELETEEEEVEVAEEEVAEAQVDDG